MHTGADSECGGRTRRARGWRTCRGGGGRERGGGGRWGGAGGWGRERRVVCGEREREREREREVFKSRKGWEAAKVDRLEERGGRERRGAKRGGEQTGGIASWQRRPLARYAYE
eukprot:3144941-Rhodomonas_salina.1